MTDKKNSQLNFFKPIFWIVAPCLLWVSTFSAVYAQAGAEAGILQKNLQQQVPQIDPLPQTEAPKVIPPTIKPKEDPNAIRILVNAFHIRGATLFTDVQLQAVVKPYVGKYLTLAELQDVANTVSNFYQSQGKIAQVQLPPQKLDEGIVILQVLEGRLGAVNVKLPEHPRVNKNLIQGYVEVQNPIGQTIDTQAIDRALFLLQETPGIQFESALEPGKQDGEINLNVDVKDTALFTGNAGVNNYGSRSTGQIQTVGAIGVMNPLGHGDQVAFNAIISQGSNFFIASYITPLNHDGLRLTLSASDLHYTNIDSFQTNGSFGWATVGSANLSYALLRSQTANLNIYTSYDHKTYMNKFIGSALINSNYMIRNINAGLSGNHYDKWFGGGVTSFSLSATSGYLSFYSDQYADSSTYGTNTPANFQKLNFSISRNQQVIPDQTVINVSFSGQLATQNLDPAEQFYLGGPYGVRSYPVGQGRGSQGFLGTVELQQKLPQKIIGTISLQAGRIQQYVNLYPDWQGATGANNWYNLFGVGPGLRWSQKNISLSASVSWAVGSNPLRNAQGQQVNVDNWNKPAYAWAQAVIAF